jgi:hypothetical protein
MHTESGGMVVVAGGEEAVSFFLGVQASSLSRRALHHLVHYR